MIKHEIISCERCGIKIECRANAYSRCQCSIVQLTLIEAEYIGERFEDCLCAACLQDLKEEYAGQNGLLGR